MENNYIANKLNEELVREMTILKLKKHYEFIEREEFKEAIINLRLKLVFQIM